MLLRVLTAPCGGVLLTRSITEDLTRLGLAGAGVRVRSAGRLSDPLTR